MTPTLFIDPVQAPHPWTLPWDRPSPHATSVDLIRQARHLVEHHAPGPVALRGGEPLRHPALHEALSILTEAGHHAIVHSRLPGLDDDLPIRDFAPHDVRFHVPFPTQDPSLMRAWTDGQGDLEQLTFALRNLSAFAYPVSLVAHATPDTVHTLADTVAHLLRQWTATPVHVEVLRGEPSDPNTWRHTPSWLSVGEQLRALQTRDLRLPPRVHLVGMPALALPLEDFDRLDLRVHDKADEPLEIPVGYQQHHGPLSIDGEALAKRRVWLVTAPKDRPSWRSHPMDRFSQASSVVLIRPGHPVFSVLERKRPGVPYLVQTTTHGVAVAGRFREAPLAARFREICVQVRAKADAAPPQGLKRLRELAHVLRRSMKPKHDENPPRALEEHD